MSRISEGGRAGEVVIFLTHYAGWPADAKLSMTVEELIARAESAKNSDAERNAGV